VYNVLTNHLPDISPLRVRHFWQLKGILTEPMRLDSFSSGACYVYFMLLMGYILILSLQLHFGLSSNAFFFFTHMCCMSCLPQHFVFKYLQSLFFPQNESEFYTHANQWRKLYLYVFLHFLFVCLEEQYKDKNS
jgi:hypothetical protein